MPEELSQFAKENGVTLVTHSDPSELLPGDSLRWDTSDLAPSSEIFFYHCRTMLYPKLSREAGHYTATWISR